jgi:hypothetical protein
MFPSTRDLLQVLATRRRAVAVIAQVPADRPDDVVHALRADVSAVAFDGEGPDLAHVARHRPATLCLVPALSREQAWAARMAGADGIVVPACATEEEALSTLDAARRTHMLAAIDVADAGEVASALATSPRAVLLADRTLVDRFPPPVVAIVRAAGADDARALRGLADAALLAPEATLETDFSSLVQELES